MLNRFWSSSIVKCVPSLFRSKSFFSFNSFALSKVWERCLIALLLFGWWVYIRGIKNKKCPCGHGGQDILKCPKVSHTMKCLWYWQPHLRISAKVSWGHGGFFVRRNSKDVRDNKSEWKCQSPCNHSLQHRIPTISHHMWVLRSRWLMVCWTEKWGEKKIRTWLRD